MTIASGYREHSQVLLKLLLMQRVSVYGTLHVGNAEYQTLISE